MNVSKINACNEQRSLLDFACETRKTDLHSKGCLSAQQFALHCLTLPVCLRIAIAQILGVSDEDLCPPPLNATQTKRGHATCPEGQKQCSEKAR